MTGRTRFVFHEIIGTGRSWRSKHKGAVPEPLRLVSVDTHLCGSINDLLFHEEPKFVPWRSLFVRVAQDIHDIVADLCYDFGLGNVVVFVDDKVHVD